ncbi:LacI family transcriptional regulator [Aureimonas leprariae]|uniref:LacI family transcriptional regulator n=2 Tax=Plantimonas leprariae TaxID=2615207 RepID=A0A7V7TVQ4_9HYPH|nr:LacI family transcriptional regulator [Aureimonas leprariae]
MVAERAGVSVATVSNVLNNKASVSPDFAERVLKAVGELGYVVDIAASRLRSGRAALVGVVVPDLTNPMFATFVSTLEHAARLAGFDLVVVSARNDPAEEADRLSRIRSWRPAGLIVIPCDGALAERLPIGLGGTPVVVADRIPDSGGFDLVAVDNGPAAARIARHLGSEGYGSCLVVGTSLAISNVRERWDGIRAAAGPTYFEIVEIGIGDAARLDAVESRLADARRPEALFALDHVTALELYKLVGRLGLRVPADIAFAGFDEMEWMRLVSPPVTAVRQPVEDMAHAAWQRLVKRMENDAATPTARRLECAVTIRGSTARQPGASREDEAA